MSTRTALPAHQCAGAAATGAQCRNMIADPGEKFCDDHRHLAHLTATPNPGILRTGPVLDPAAGLADDLDTDPDDLDDLEEADDEEDSESDDAVMAMIRAETKATSAAVEADMSAQAKLAAVEYEKVTRFETLTNELGEDLAAVIVDDGYGRDLRCLACVDLAEFEAGDNDYHRVTHRRIDLDDECEGCGNAFADSLPLDILDDYDAA